MGRDNIRVSNLAHLASLKMSRRWEEFDRFGHIDRALVGLWFLLLVGSFSLLLYWYLTTPLVLPCCSPE
jgi:hypothetical protein